MQNLAWRVWWLINCNEHLAIVTGAGVEHGQDEFSHQLVNGLPKAMLAWNGKTFAVLELMQRCAGLNRDQRREMLSVVKTPGKVIVRLLVKNFPVESFPDPQLKLLSFYLDADQRFQNFWFVAKQVNNRRPSNKTYAVAVDLQLLRAYDENWSDLHLDEDVLMKTCPEWGRIRCRIEGHSKYARGNLPLQVFMLWPRLVEDLDQWGELKQTQRFAVSNAVFALSSISSTAWFISAAIKLCPELASELGEFCEPVSSMTADPELPKADSPENVAARLAEKQPNIESETSDFDEVPSPTWVSLLARLDVLADELKSLPTRESVSELAILASEFEAHSASLPSREPLPEARFQSKLCELLTHLKTIALSDGFAWLDDGLIAQIEARWRLSARMRDSETQLNDLATDAVAAIERCDIATAICTEATQALAGAQARVVEAESKLAKANGFASQQAAKRSLSDAKRSQLDAESVYQARQEKLIDAASPFEEPYDFSCNYFAQLEEEEKVAGGPSMVAEMPEADHSALTVEITEGQMLEGDSRLADVFELPTEDSVESVVPPAVDIPPTPGDAIQSAVEPVAGPELSLIPLPTEAPCKSPSPVGTENPSPEESDVGRPIWQLLETGRPALAFHVAKWLQEVDSTTVVPSPDLLAAVALQEALTLPDGNLQAAISQRYERLDVGDLGAGGSSTWNNALSLLLAAATLRPMILAPNTGASSVAAYLHHDGHYPVLYELVKQLRELSPLLMGFRVDPGILRQARGEASIRAELQALQHEAEDWLRVQAPAKTIKFSAATDVWRHWLRAGGVIDSLVAPVAHNRVQEAERVREMLETMSDPDNVIWQVHNADRKELRRRKGEDIHAGALEHLMRNVEEALRLPRRWLSLVELLGRQGGRLRELLERVHGALRESSDGIASELSRVPESDPIGMIHAAQSLVLREFKSLVGLFDIANDQIGSEPHAADVLYAPLLLVPDLPIGEDWSIELPATEALASLVMWLTHPLSAAEAATRRLERGDVLGAEMLVGAGLHELDNVELRKARERLKQALSREIAECRRSVEVGSAYGYLVDADRGQMESQLAQWEAQVEEQRRFDVVWADLKLLRTRVVDARTAQAGKVRDALRNLTIPDELRGAVTDVEKALTEGDIATANELVHWLSQGRPPPTELQSSPSSEFIRFFPAAMRAIESWLEGQRRDVVEAALKHGQAIPGVETRRPAGAQRDQAASMYGDWSDMKAQGMAAEQCLKRLITGLGLTVRSLQRADRVAGRESWMLDTHPLEDRDLCPIPMFGSLAAGRYRLLCVWGRPTEDELMQWVGDTAVGRPVLLLYFGRMTERKWQELSRQAKAKRRSFLLLDETLLVHLCCATGSRLRAWLHVAIPFTFSSPYDATAGLVPPEMFYGRNAELEAVIGSNGRCFIYGGRQLGKTALLRRAEQAFHNPARGQFARWVDLRAEGLGVSRAPSELWTTLHEKLKELRVLDMHLPAPVPGKKQGIDGILRGIRDFLAVDSDRRVLLLLDEADRFFEQDGKNDFEQTRRLKQLMDDSARRFKVVFAGLHNVLRMTERANHPLAHFGEPIEIGPLREGEEARDAANLIRVPMAAAGFEFESPGLVLRILAQTNYYPSLIQLYCSHLLKHMLSQASSRPKGLGPIYPITDRDIEQVYSSDALRDEIRLKFRLTLQLDLRYEVIAYAMALDLLRDRYSQNDGIAWQTIRQSGAGNWWPEGFRDTSELDFRVLLDEMVGLGVLRRLSGGRYALRNPNVLLLLGSQDEIEAVLIKDREPVVEFESATFRPPMRAKPSSPERNVLTYQQLSHLLHRSNRLSVVTGTQVAGIDNVVTSLVDYLGSEAAPVVLNRCSDSRAFVDALQAALTQRKPDLVTVIIVPSGVAWTRIWVEEANAKLKRLQSDSKFASVIFIADPAALWQLLGSDRGEEEVDLPWVSLLHWRDEFLRHWLDERQLRLEPEDRKHLVDATGGWPALLADLVGDCTEHRMLRSKIASAGEQWLSSADQVTRWQRAFGVDVSAPSAVIEVLARLGEPVEVGELAAVAEVPLGVARTALHWAELLGLAHSEGAGFWTVDPIATKVLVANTK